MAGRIPERCVEAQAQLEALTGVTKTMEDYYTVMLRVTNENKARMDNLEKTDTDLRIALFGNGKKGVLDEHSDKILRLETTQKIYIAEVAAVGAVVIGLLIKLVFF